MIKFRKKPIVVEAEQWFPESLTFFGIVLSPISSRNARAFNISPGKRREYGLIEYNGCHFLVSTGDWIIRDPSGELKPCKQDVFDLLYEKIEE